MVNLWVVLGRAAWRSPFNTILDYLSRAIVAPVRFGRATTIIIV